MNVVSDNFLPQQYLLTSLNLQVVSDCNEMKPEIAQLYLC